MRKIILFVCSIAAFVSHAYAFEHAKSYSLPTGQVLYYRTCYFNGSPYGGVYITYPFTREYGYSWQRGESYDNQPGYHTYSNASDGDIDYYGQYINNIYYQYYNYCGYTMPSGNLVIPDSINGKPVVGIGWYAFYGCDSITSITIPSTVRRINSLAFWGCNNISTIIVDADTILSYCEEVQYGGSYSNMYYLSGGNFNCSNLQKLIIGPNVKYIGAGSFLGCLNIDTILFNADSCVLGFKDYYRGTHYNNTYNQHFRYGWLGCDNKYYTNDSCDTRHYTNSFLLRIGDNVRSISDYAFCTCSEMRGEFSLQNLNYLGKYAFSGCQMISSITLGDEVTEIKEKTFEDCNHLVNITLGQGLIRIAADAFGGCSEIQSITSRALNPPLVYNTTFEDVDTGIPVFVPCEAVSAYQHAPFWNHFINIDGYNYIFSITSDDVTMGSVTIVNAPTCDNIEALIQANPYHNFHFVRWSDGNFDNPRYVVVTQDTVLVAIFASGTNGVDGISVKDISIWSAHGNIYVEGVGEESVHVFDIMGRSVGNHSLPTGVYLVKVSTYPARKVLVIR